MNIVPGNNNNAVVWYINGSSVLELLIKIVVFLIFEILGHSILPFTLSLCSFLGFRASTLFSLVYFSFVWFDFARISGVKIAEERKQKRKRKWETKQKQQEEIQERK